jgi:hypothetical protein
MCVILMKNTEEEFDVSTQSHQNEYLLYLCKYNYRHMLAAVLLNVNNFSIFLTDKLQLKKLKVNWTPIFQSLKFVRYTN